MGSIPYLPRLHIEEGTESALFGVADDATWRKHG